MDNMNCRSCAAPLDGRNLDRRLAIITCGHCGAIFDLTRRSGQEQDSREPQAATPAVDAPARAPVPMPGGIRVDRGEKRLKVSWRWFTPKDLFLIMFAFCWDAFLVFWYSQALDSPFGGGPQLIMILFPLIHVAVGVSITYRALAGLLNRTTVTVESDVLRIRHFPLPWLPAPTIPVADLEQLYVSKKITRGKNGTSVGYEVRAVTREHAGRKLLGGLENIDQALWVEQEIELLLGIRDRRVAGEVKEDGVWH